MKKITWIYLASYLSLGGIGFSFLPEVTLKIFLSNGEYGVIMPRLVGMFMIALGGIITTMTFNNDLRYYSYAMFIRTGMVAFILWLYMISKDPMMIAILIIILLGLLPSWYVYLMKSE